MKKLLHILFVFFVLEGYGQKILIVGKADKEYFSQVIRAFKEMDHISERKELIATDTIDSKGFFSLTFTSSVTEPVTLTIGNRQALLYTEPGKTYKLGVLRRDSSITETIGKPVLVDLVFMNSDSTELNYLISDFDGRLDDFLKKQMGEQLIDQHPEKMKLDSNELRRNQKIALLNKLATFEKSMQLRYAYVKNPFFSDYMKYTCASHKYPLMSRDQFFQIYFKDKAVRYDQKEYMILVSTFLSTELEPKLYTDKVFQMINENESFTQLKTYLSGLNYTKGDTLSELAAVVLLKTALTIKPYKKIRVSNTFRNTTADAKLNWIKTIASNLDHELCRLIEGVEAPDFHLPDRSGYITSLKDFPGKYIYIQFWRSDIVVCEEQMRLIPELKRKYGSKIVFVSICIDEDKKQMEKFLSRYPKFDWTFLHVPDTSTVKEDYSVKAAPQYYLINPFGKFTMAPAMEPDIEMEKVFHEILYKGKKPFMPGQKEN